MPVRRNYPVGALGEPSDRPPPDHGTDRPPRLAAVPEGVGDRRSPGRTVVALDEPDGLRALLRRDAQGRDVGPLPRLHREIPA